MKPWTVFDLETASGPLDQIERCMPEFQPPANFKNPEAIERNIKEQKDRWIQSAALNPMTGRAVCIGYADSREIAVKFDPNATEACLIASIWLTWLGRPGRWIGWNVKHFDFPFLIRRSWILGIEVPLDLVTFSNGRPKWSDRIVDLYEWWTLGNREDARGSSLDNVVRACGLGMKNGNGADFSKLWESNREQAIEYLKNDLELTKKLAVRLGALPEGVGV